MKIEGAVTAMISEYPFKLENCQICNNETIVQMNVYSLFVSVMRNQCHESVHA